MVSGKATVASLKIPLSKNTEKKERKKDFFNHRQIEATKPQAGHMDTMELMSSLTLKKTKVFWNLKVLMKFIQMFSSFFSFCNHHYACRKEIMG